MTPRPDHGAIALTGSAETLRADRLELPVRAYRPPVSGPCSAVLVCPGGIQKGMFEPMEWIATRLAADGVFALTLSWRGPSPLHDPDDVKLAIEWLKRQPDVDGGRIGIMGLSRGGGAALRSAALHRELKAVATMGAATDFLVQANGLETYAPGRHRMIIDWLGDPVGNRAFYEQVQAISYADRIKQPTLLIHGSQDMLAPPEQSMWMKDRMEQAGARNVELEIVPMMGHYGEYFPGDYCFKYLGDRFAGFFADKLAAATERSQETPDSA